MKPAILSSYLVKICLILFRAALPSGRRSKGKRYPANKLAVALLSIASIFIFTISPVFSYTASNENIKLDTQVLGEKEPIKLESKKAPQNIIVSPKNSSISFSISDDFVIFGKVVPGEPLQRTITLVVDNRSNSGYSVLASENSMLTDAKTNAVVPDTTCDDGICSDLLGATWNSPLTYGFGMRCDNTKGTACTLGFDQGYYKQFPNLKSGKKMQQIMSVQGASEVSARITYKLNLAPAQSQGSYQNIITYILAPNY